MKFIVQHIVYPITILAGILVLLFYVLWIKYFPQRRNAIEPTKVKKHVHFSNLPDWNLN